VAWLDRKHAEIYYELHKVQGECITLVNGYTRSGSDFRLLAKDLNAKGYSCLFLDNRGAGQTKNDPNYEFVFEDWLADIESIWEKEKISRTHLLGISMGGFICQRLTLRQNEATITDKMMLISTAFDPKAIHEPIPWSLDMGSIEKKLTDYFSSSYLSKNKLVVAAMVKQIHKEIEGGNFILRAKLQRQALKTMLPLELNLVAKKHPSVMVVHGDEDNVIPYREAEILAKIWNGARLELFSGAGHLLLAERSKDLKEKIIDFLNS